MRRLLPLLLLVLCVTPAQAVEGMWTPSQLPKLASELEALGMRIAPAALSDLHGQPMNAVISLGGCTASFVSPDGLVITNHHCAYGAIQQNSTEEANLLRDGFLAESREKEPFAGPGSRVYVTVEVSDVTGKVLGGLTAEQTGKARYDAIEAREKELIAACEEDEGHRCNVASFYGGLEYHLIKQLEIRDVRLVHAPAGSVGKYGGDIDNWMWPRHTGDYSFFRAYVGPDGKPADHDAANVPYHPRHWLRVATDGLKDGDFVMAAGYPGRTSRYRMGREVESTFGWSYPTRKALYDEWLGIIAAETAEDAGAAIKYASLVAGLNNASKNYQGMLDGFAKSDILERKARQEEELQTWIERGGEMREQYRKALGQLRELIDEEEATRERDLYFALAGSSSYYRSGSAVLGAARMLYRLSREREKPDAEREPGYQERDEIRIKERLMRMERTYAPGVDRAVWSHFIQRYAEIPAGQHVPAFDEWFGIKGTKVDAATLDRKLEKMYARTELGETEKRLAWMDAKPDAFHASDDPFLKLAVQLYPGAMEREAAEKDLEGRFQEVRPRFMAAMLAWLGSQGKAVYPDANSTLRVTYGTVKGYSPVDAVQYSPFTTLAGILEKDTGQDPFDSPPALLELAREGRYGSWLDESLGSVPVNFLTDLDSTGGNSGSPTMNRNGELVGLLFDGNYESINADWDFNEKITRTIHVDMRYVLWVMENVDQAHALMREMGVAPSVQAQKR